MFTIRSRESWRAKPARSISPQNPANVHTLVVHHTAGTHPTKLTSAAAEMRSIQRLHMDGQGWSDIGYNFVVDRAGRVWEGRGYCRLGAHTLMHNSGTIGVSFMGNYEHLKLNRRQKLAFRALKLRLRSKGVKFTSVKGHQQMPDQSTACPGKNIMRQLGL